MALRPRSMSPCPNVICPARELGSKMCFVPLLANSRIATALCGLALISWAQDKPRQNETPGAVPETATVNYPRNGDRTLSLDDGLSIIAAALDRKVRSSERDCSHLVHAIYQRAGFPYAFASSSELYAGVERFERVTEAQPGDLVVWKGHVGIVIKPSQHIFFSYMRSGPGIDDYEARYWKKRGRPRFYRYVEDQICSDCTGHSASFMPTGQHK